MRGCHTRKNSKRLRLPEKRQPTRHRPTSVSPLFAMKIYYHDNLDTDQRLPHEGPPALMADLEAIGVYGSNIPEQAEVDRIAEEKGYKNRDEVRIMGRSWLLAPCTLSLG